MAVAVSQMVHVPGRRAPRAVAEVAQVLVRVHHVAAGRGHLRVPVVRCVLLAPVVVVALVRGRPAPELRDRVVAMAVPIVVRREPAVTTVSVRLRVCAPRAMPASARNVPFRRVVIVVMVRGRRVLSVRRVRGRVVTMGRVVAHHLAEMMALVAQARLAALERTVHQDLVVREGRIAALDPIVLLGLVVKAGLNAAPGLNVLVGPVVMTA